MSDIDFSILVGNLVENAMEACSKAPLGNRRIVLNCTADKNKLILDLKNTFDGNVKKIGSKLISSKKVCTVWDLNRSMPLLTSITVL